MTKARPGIQQGKLDPLSPSERSERMSRIRGKDTKPELKVRHLVHSLGFRYRLHRSDLPGKPDLVFPSRNKVIFVHGCFWHLHGCNQYRYPKSKLEFWGPKLAENQRRDVRNQDALAENGWKALVIWECELRDEQALVDKIRTFLEGT